MRTLCLLLLVISITVCSTVSAQRIVPVIPKPRMIKDTGGSVLFRPSKTYIRLSVRDTAGVAPAIEDISSTSARLYGDVPSLVSTTGFGILAGVAGVDPTFDRLCERKGITPDARLGEEGYTLSIGRDAIIVAARGTRGLFYGLESLHQLVRSAAADQGRLPAITITDWPDLRVRAVMDDISRGPIPTPEFFRRQIRRYAELKVNSISYYTENVVRTKSHPAFAPAGGALSVAEWKELAAYARRRHIDLVGSFQSFGHFEKILSTPQYAHLADGKSLLSPALEQSYSFLNDIYREMVPAFTAPYFNVNCDETFELGQGRSRVLVDSMGKGRVYLHHVLRIREMLAGLGVRMMIWGDILLQYPTIIDSLPRDVIIGTWTYDSLADFHKYITPFRSRGLDVLVTPGVLNTSSVIPNFTQAFINIQRFIRDGCAHNVLGALTTVWDDGGTALFSNDWYGVAFAADRMWHCDTTDRSYGERFDRALYADRTHALSRGLDTLMLLGDLIATDGMNEKHLWSQMIPDGSRRFRLNTLDWDSVRTIAGRVERILAEGRPLVGREDYESVRFVAELYQVVARLAPGMLTCARRYAQARTLEESDPGSARSLVVSAMSIVSDLRSAFTRTRDMYSFLWLAENRLYALDAIQRRYDERITDLLDVERRLREALAGLEQGVALPSAGNVRLDIEESKGWYFKDWLVTGPIMGNDLAIDYLQAMGGEAGKTAPQVTQEFLFAGKKARWSRLSARSAAEIDLGTHHAESGPSTVYAFATVESPRETVVTALLGLGGTGRLRVNGVTVFERATPDDLAPDRDTLRLPLVRGINQILVKICRADSASWGFSLQLPESEVRNRKNRYRLIE